MLPNKRKLKKTLFFNFGLFWSFFNQETAKIDKNEEDCQNPNGLMKFSEILYVDASQQKNAITELFFGFGLF